jgi:type I restriction enzyme R subunit
LGDTRLKSMGNSWKHFSARWLNAQANGRLLAGVPADKGGKTRRASVWQGETYDHIVRSWEQFTHYRQYLAENPRKANLKEGEYTLFLPEVEFSNP